MKHPHADPAENLRTLIRCPSVTPAEAGALDAIENMLAELGFAVERKVFAEPGTAEVDNLYARIGDSRPHLMFAGHSDVVPPGDETAWKHPPFAAEVADGLLYGRGAVDMKGGIACFIAALARYLDHHKEIPAGSVSLLITGDEEGPSINGTDKLLAWADAKGEKWDGAIVGEPTNPSAVGDAIKIGRRGSLSGKIIVRGRQGHSAYPQLADNPVNGLLDLLDALLHEDFDEGTSRFQPTNLEVTSIDIGNPATNVIPERAVAAFNIRFNDRWDGDSVRREIESRLARGARSGRLRRHGEGDVAYAIEWVGRVSPVFLTHEETLIDTLSQAVEEVCGNRPELSTGGGTSDARFIKDYCPVVEFGLVGQTMHQIDERVLIDDLETLTQIYLQFLEGYFSADRKE